MAIPDFHGVPVLVTGGAGFIGSHLVDALVRRGARVRVLDDLSTGARRNLAHPEGTVELLEGDVRDADTCRRACRGVRYVFHQAALGSVPRSMARPLDTLAVNAGGTGNVFVAAREEGAERVVWASSSSVYGDSERLPKREGEEGEPLSPYAASKAMGEVLAAACRHAYGQAIVGLRYFNVYGPRQDPQGPYAAVIPRFFAAALAGEPAVIHGDGEQSRDFTFVDDAVAANLLAAGAPERAWGRAYNVAAGARTTVIELARAVGEAVGGARPPRHEPPRPGDVRHSLAALERVGSDLGYQPATALADGLERTARWYARRQHDGAADDGAGEPGGPPR
ncbi:MAG TPA: SDR family NAD(P)-dependent oxidoreductase [Thermoanaerobaculia bacterium]|nr:SDR family NAD(P)-dependent oxidoreductase [Thermoanaerobaculia bacterium]